MKFSKILKDIRLEENISVNNLSKLSGVSNAYISKLENDKRNFPTIRTLYLLLAGLKNSKFNDQSKSSEEINDEIKEILYKFLSAEDSEFDKKEFETIYENFITFYEDMHKKNDNKDKKNRKKNLFEYEDNENKKQSLNLQKPINDLAFHLNDGLNEKFFNGVLLDDYDKNMINEILHSFLITKLSQEQVDLNEDIEQLQKDFNDFRKESMLNKKQLKMFAIHNNIQSLKDNKK
ncbi:helix-turn-helix domain-containing protein [Staphylococcus lugdunensis]|uniref:helix-turn-helix domain-containing protein n=1 Tax=Staphylococcus lugdunensis TaxID=28035 RepID=UPI000A10BDCB|nr:helix-turn-helix domain-containing protein [Staphylococcus lugdunensis]ARJ17277.1 transcriptional regulator [Staphylococcus lugdunensis]MCH8658858.1 helix-turn-helix domain-containing protein [Staphylococcus lugdunensis]MCH8669193.1 helix-turn-helix domain-containing protein [Staphylococcus lugdunensis]